MTTQLTTESYIYAMDKNNKPALTVKSGSQVEIDTFDCFQDQIQSEETTFNAIDWNQINPATGPVYVEEAQPGDILKVTIDDIQLGDQGVMVVGPELGVMGHRMEKFEVKIIPVKDDKAIFNEKIALPLNPMIGVIGVAPEGDAVNNGTPGAHGGNMDTKLITTGATLYFPVFQPGALFALGDLHAAMGDGEISVSGIEIPAKVKVTLEVIKGHSINYPILENEDGVATLVSKELLDEAANVAVEEMIDLLQPQTDLSLAEFTMLMSAAGQAQISQIVDPLKTARFFVPRSILEAYDIKLFQKEVV
ncbi:acetamidase/formamidase family protein [Bacillus sp. ISL-35]|uniref:acetamidase/formamidase family protein n=1 Tax=Bacillus sp. ISL-35 TaxID=2819122 RepID=UPI001BEA803D|nr:acetamidase/formamidase family protein [Bacillus sp. ISL-35]MBT2680622.1 acetamidase/formamidase family protein [Bacillus sp. ISL-35]MBT2702747.1 acetamidase/formamidase family protein [Chryseobacterium sp. ISL-80]